MARRRSAAAECYFTRRNFFFGRDKKKVFFYGCFCVKTGIIKQIHNKREPWIRFFSFSKQKNSHF